MKICLTAVLLAGLMGCMPPAPRTLDGMTLEEILNEPYTADQFL